MVMRIFPPSPELFWLQGLISVSKKQDADLLWDVYQFLLWFGRMRKAKPDSEEYLVAYGYTLSYRESVYNEQLTEAEKKSVRMAEIGYSELKEKHGKA